jgi:hypothetical protein
MQFQGDFNHKFNLNIQPLRTKKIKTHSYLKEKNALQGKSRTIIVNNLGALVARYPNSYNSINFQAAHFSTKN